MNNLIVCHTEVKDLDEKGIVVFHANTFNNVDSDKQNSLPGSFKKTLHDNGQRLRHLKYHDVRLMPGVIKEIGEDQIGLLVKSQLILNTQLGRETYEEYKAMHEANRPMEHSVRVQSIKSVMNKDIEDVSEWKLWEVSTLTAWGANSQALSVSIKNLKDASREQIESEITFCKALLNINSYDDLKLENIEKQISYLLKLKAALQPDNSTDSRTLQELNKLLTVIKK